MLTPKEEQAPLLLLLFVLSLLSFASCATPTTQAFTAYNPDPGCIACTCTPGGEVNCRAIPKTDAAGCKALAEGQK